MLLNRKEYVPLDSSPEPMANTRAADDTPTQSVSDVEVEIARLAILSPLEYELQRNAAAKRLGVRSPLLDREVARRRPPAPCDASGQGRALSLDERDPWDDPVDGALLLDAIAAQIGRYIVLPEDSAYAAALWVVASYAFEEFYIFPRLFITSPEKRCGKSTFLDVIERFVNRPLVASNIGSAALFRAIEAARPTMILDEADTFMRDDEGLRGVVNSGHKRNGAAVRCVGDDAEPRQFATFAPMVIAGIGRQHETIEDRSITISLRRKRDGEAVENFRPDRALELDQLARKAARFVADRRSLLAAADPEMPEPLTNRRADNWRPLFAIADAAGGEWPERARRIARQMPEGAESDTSLNVMLLEDVRELFARCPDKDFFHSAYIVQELAALEHRPWPEFRQGKPISAHALARLLAEYGIRPGNIRDGADVKKGYHREHFADAFDRYLPAAAVRTATPLQAAESVANSHARGPLQSFPCSGSSGGENASGSAACSAIAVGSAGDGSEETTWTV